MGYDFLYAFVDYLEQMYDQSYDLSVIDVERVPFDVDVDSPRITEFGDVKR